MPFVAKALQGEQSRLRYRRCLFECHAFRLQRQCIFTSTDIFGETAPVTAQVPEHFITRLELHYIFANCFNSPCYIGAEYLFFRF